MKKRLVLFDDSDDNSETESDKLKLKSRKKQFKIPEYPQPPSFPVNEQNEDYMKYQLQDDKHEEPTESAIDKKDCSLFLNPSTSIGLTIMERMGFKIGNALGNSATAIKEPIEVSLKSGRQGLGGGFKPLQYKQEDVENLKLNLANSNKQRIELRDLKKIMKLCFELSGEYDKYLEGEDITEVNSLWQTYVKIYVLKQKSAAVGSLKAKFNAV